MQCELVDIFCWAMFKLPDVHKLAMTLAQECSMLLQYCAFVEDDTEHHRFDLLKSLANTCQMHREILNPHNQVWREKAAVYRQHALACLKRQGRTIPSRCGVCRKTLNAEKPQNWTDPESGIIVCMCGHMQHWLCEMSWKGPPGQICASCPKPA